VDLDMLRLLISAGAFVTVRPVDGSTPLLAAANAALFAGHDRRGRVLSNEEREVDAAEQLRIADVLQLLIDSGADVNEPDKAGNTVLHLVAGAGLDTLVRLLADHGAMLNVKNQRQQTPLQAAQARARRATAELLQSLGAQ
jgi:ankyrin repeat protein